MFRLIREKNIRELTKKIEILESENKHFSGYYQLFQNINPDIPNIIFQLEFKENLFLIPFSSENTYKILNCHPHELINNVDLFFDVFSEKDKAKLIKTLSNSSESTRELNFEFLVNSPKATSKYLKFIAHPQNNTNSHTCWDIVVIDITKQRSLEKTLQQSQKNLESLINSSDDYIWSVDRNLNLLTINENYLRVFKLEYDIELLQGRNIIEQLPKSIQQLWVNRYERALNGERYLIEEFHNSDNNASFIEMYLNPIYNDNKIIGVSIFARDITQKKQVEIELDSLARLPSENPDPVLRVFKDGTVINSNQSGEELLKYWNSKIGGILPDNLIIEITNVLSSGNRIEIEEKYKGIAYSISFTPVQEKEYVNIYARDVSDQKEAELALRESEERLRAIFGAANNVSFILTDASDPDPIIIDFSPGAENLFKFTKYEILGKPVSLLLPMEEVKKLPGIHKKMRSGKEGYKGEINHIRKDGEVFPANFSTYPLFDSNKSMFASLLVSLDITERKDLERTIINAIINTEEKERERFASDLHDGLGPLLSSVKLYLKVMSKSIKTGKENLVKDAFEVIDESIKSIKTISNNLSPHILNDFGLYAAINAFVKKVNIPDYIRVSLESDVKNIRFNKNIEIILYRIAKELINNTLKHASATKISISLLKKNNRLLLEYIDNGVGFDTKKILGKESKGLGLFSIRNRLRSINGEVKIHSKIGHGVKFNIDVKIVSL